MIAPARSRRSLRSLGSAEDGLTIIEFAIVAPVLTLMLVGLFDIGHTAYMTAVLQGAVQKAARDSTLQNSTTNSIDAVVRQQVKQLNGGMAAPTITRRFFRDYNAAAAHQHEPYNDTNTDGRCDNGESYTDTNSNGVWDSDGADSGQGGAEDRTVYTVTVSYARLLPLDRFINIPHDVTLSASTILANQPYATQNQYAATPATRTCP